MASEAAVDSNSHPGSKFLVILQVSGSLLPSDESLYTLMAPAALCNELVQSPLPAEAPRGPGLCFFSLSPAPIIASGIQRVLIKLLNIFE